MNQSVILREYRARVKFLINTGRSRDYDVGMMTLRRFFMALNVETQVQSDSLRISLHWFTRIPNNNKVPGGGVDGRGEI